MMPAKAQDAQTLAQIAAQNNFSAHWDGAAFAAEIALNTALVFKAEIAPGVTTGFISYRITPPEAELTNFAVAAAHTRQGIGAKLLAESLQALQQKGVKTLTLEVNINNAPALALYNKYGFTQTATRKKFYNNTDDALILRKQFI